jgi:hypothetical protein
MRRRITVMRERKDWAQGITSFGPDFGRFPADHWGIKDWELVNNRYQPIGETLPAPASVLLPGFRLFPGQAAPLTAGQRAVAEIRARQLRDRIGRRP